ncbi:uncharacterized protein LOC130747700 isoform X3 [Lotus japonicus]|uniref:uncharacterized protein LOC130747700 isoform X3 n=1 Tax=Lotus japonicus TaxID=34305 RepID=UPI002586A96E|nr:uncharacterized protein LOC130747700 isoform X3 [Lotus japonicus]
MVRAALIRSVRNLNRNSHLPMLSLRVRFASDHLEGHFNSEKGAMELPKSPEVRSTIAPPEADYFNAEMGGMELAKSGQSFTITLPSSRFYRDPAALRDAKRNVKGLSEGEARELFECWCRKYRKIYPSEEHKLYRFTVFKETLERCTIEAHVHVYADLTSQERKGLFFQKPLYSPDPDSTLIPNPDGSFYSQTEARQVFEIWCNHYHRSYPSEQEKLYRFTVFKESLEFVARLNHKRDHPKAASFGICSLADLTSEEKQEVMGDACRWRPLRNY